MGAGSKFYMSINRKSLLSESRLTGSNCIRKMRTSSVFSVSAASSFGVLQKHSTRTHTPPQSTLPPPTHTHTNNHKKHINEVALYNLLLNYLTLLLLLFHLCTVLVINLYKTIQLSFKFIYQKNCTNIKSLIKYICNIYILYKSVQLQYIIKHFHCQYI